MTQQKPRHVSPCSTKQHSHYFRVKKPGIEFRVSGRDDEEISFDNLRVWKLE